MGPVQGAAAEEPTVARLGRQQSPGHSEMATDTGPVRSGACTSRRVARPISHRFPKMRTDQPPRLALTLFAVAGLLAVVLSVGLSRLVGPGESVEQSIVIPAGTAARLAAGQDVAIIPDGLHFRLRDRLVVLNQDNATHRVGPFTVLPGGRLEKLFSEAATIDGFCSLHASGRITIDIGGS